MSRFPKPRFINILSSILLLSQVSLGSTGVNNGGDTVFSFLSVTRKALNTAIEFLSKEQKFDEICRKGQSLAKRQFCTQFVEKTLVQLDNTKHHKDIDFLKLKYEPLTVKTSKGSTIQVEARTALGPDGPIEFNYDRVKMMSPRQLLFLIGHELSHKVIFEGSPIGDDDVRGPFASGRELLDLVAWGFSDYAASLSLVGDSFDVWDFFACEFSENGKVLAKPRMASLRFYPKGKANLDHYEISIGHRPKDPTFPIRGRNDRFYELKLKISEPHGCRDPKVMGATLRMMTWEEGQDPSLAAESKFTNPLCSTNPLELIVASANNDEKFRFRCLHYGVHVSSSM